MTDDLEGYLTRFGLSDDLRRHVLAVLVSMPAEIVSDLTADEGFVVTEYDSTPGTVGTILVPSPGRRPARAVVLKRRMWRRDEPFVRWVIAHELAHAHLHNRGRFEGEDPEHAADALAAEWGFVRPGQG